MNQRCRKYLLLLCLLLSLFPLFAQKEENRDKITLKNGSILYGEILEEKEKEFITLKISEETTLVIPFDEISTVIKGINRTVDMPKRSLPIHIKEKGLYGTYAGGIGFGNAFRDVFFMLETDITGGYRWNRYLATGIGIGSHVYPTSGNANPLYLEVRGNLTQKRMTPMYYAKVGYAVRSVRTGLSESFKAGTFFSFGFGYREYTARKFGWMYSVGYQLQATTQKWTQQVPQINPQTGNVTFITVRGEGAIGYNRIVWTWGLIF